MKTKPIPFRQLEVINTLDLRQTQFRRVINPQPSIVFGDANEGLTAHWVSKKRVRSTLWNGGTGFNDFCPYGQVGDHLWVKETWQEVNSSDGGYYCYGADYNAESYLRLKPWKSSIYIPRMASRITLEITNIRIERLQDISEQDAIAMGIESQIGFAQMTWYRDYLTKIPDGHFLGFDSPIKSVQSLWDSINKKHPWANNGWVWVIDYVLAKSTMAIAAKEDSQ